jgi:hypothetical protein
MKKLYIFILLVFIGKIISAQAYCPMLDSVNHWQNVSNNIATRLAAPSATASACMYPLYYSTVLEEYTTQDTVINSMTYKVVESTADLNPNACLVGFIREDTSARKVYFIDNLMNPEILLYDFSMTVGDTIPLSFIQDWHFTSGTFTLDSIRTVHIRAGYRRIFYLNNHAVPFSPTMPWIESVGCLVNAFYPYSSNISTLNQFSSCYTFEHLAAEFMTCFDHMKKVYYDSCAYHYAQLNSCFYMQDTCNYFNICGNVDELTSLSSFTIFPNPSSGKTTLMLDVKQKDELSILVRDVSGKQVQMVIQLGTIAEGKKEVVLDLGALPNGFYLVECKGKHSSVYQKLLIQH